MDIKCLMKDLNGRWATWGIAYPQNAMGLTFWLVLSPVAMLSAQCFPRAAFLCLSIFLTDCAVLLSHSCALWVSSYFFCGSLAWVSVRSLQWTTCPQWPFPWLTCWKLLELAEFSWTAFQSVARWFRGPDVNGFCSQIAWELVSAISQYVAFVKCGDLVVPWPFLNDDQILSCWRVSTRFVLSLYLINKANGVILNSTCVLLLLTAMDSLYFLVCCNELCGRYLELVII